ncbi:MAG TPA: hypothetical protein VNS63_21030 [Blastocatellia bacterium]|nr:hypothetical protein [Blastocatellia bacterium]
MHSPKAATILFLLTLIACPTLALTQNKSRSQRFKHSPARTSSTAEVSLPSVSLVSGTPEYLSGEANVTVKGNENPIIRLGLATSGVTLVEFPAADRFFALHPGNSEMVTIDESPTKQNDHFFVFRAGSNFVSPPAASSSTGPAASIIAQMRSGMVVTFLIYPVRELSQMAHRVVVLYDRVAVVAARRAAGLAVNLEEKEQERQERSIRIAPEAERSSTSTQSRTDASLDARPRTVEPVRLTDAPDNNDSMIKASSSDRSQQSPNVNSNTKPDRDFGAEARKALKLAITTSKPKKWTPAAHGLSIATSIPKDFNDKDGSAIVIVAVSNILPEPLRIVPGQPDLAIETRDDQGKKTLLVEQIKPLHVESSGIGDSIPAGATLYYAIVYRRPVLGVRQRLRVTVGQINAADDPAVADLTTSTR